MSVDMELFPFALVCSYNDKLTPFAFYREVLRDRPDNIRDFAAGMFNQYFYYIKDVDADKQYFPFSVGYLPFLQIC